MRPLKLLIEALLRIRPVLLQHLDELVLVPMQVALDGINEKRQCLGLVLADEAEQNGVMEKE